MDDFKEVKSKCFIKDIIEQITGTKSIKVGHDTYDIPCPFCKHKDCFRINEKDQYFKCQSCDQRGDVHNFVQQYYDISKIDALNKLAGMIGYQLNTPKKKPTKTQSIYNESVKYYQENLFQNSYALNYQTNKRNHDSNVLKKIGVGFTDGRLHLHLKSIGYTTKEMLDSGLVTQEDKGIKDFFYKGLYIYPHMSLNGDYGDFTVKNPKDKKGYQLKKEYKLKDCLFLNMKAFKHDEIIIVEGQNDLLSVMDANFDNVIATCGTLNSEQRTYLKAWCKTNKKKIIYLAFDNDPSGEKYLEYLQTDLMKYCYLDILIQKYKEDFESNIELRVITFKEKDIDLHLKDRKNKNHAMNDLLGQSSRLLLPLSKILMKYRQIINRQKEDNKDIKVNYDFKGRLCAEYFKNIGNYFRLNNQNCLYFENRIYELGSDEFEAMIYQVSNINASTRGYREIYQVIKNTCILSGRKVDAAGWLFTDLDTNEIFFNACNEENQLIRLNSGNIDFIQNGSNIKQIYLTSSPMMKPLIFEPSINIQQAFDLLHDLFFKYLACNEENKFFVLCYAIVMFFADYINAKGHVRFTGNMGSGKSTAATMLTILIYGQEYLITASKASLYREATKIPLIFIDNVESQQADTLAEPMLLMTTGIIRMKSDNNSQSENIHEKSNAFFATTGIDSLDRGGGEYQRRIIEVPYKKKYWYKGNYDKSLIYKELTKSRNLIISGLLQLISANILPNFDKKKTDALSYINAEYKGHSKEAFNDFFGVMYIILKEVTKYIKYNGSTSEKFAHNLIFEQWIKQQNENTQDANIETNDEVIFLERMLHDYLYTDKIKVSFPSIYADISEIKNPYDNDKTIYVEFTFTMGELFEYMTFSAKDRGVKLPYKNPKSLSNRINSASGSGILTGAQWEFIKRGGVNPKKKNGSLRHVLRKYCSED